MRLVAGIITMVMVLLPAQVAFATPSFPFRIQLNFGDRSAPPQPHHQRTVQPRQPPDVPLPPLPDRKAIIAELRVNDIASVQYYPTRHFDNSNGHGYYRNDDTGETLDRKDFHNENWQRVSITYVGWMRCTKNIWKHEQQLSFMRSMVRELRGLSQEIKDIFPAIADRHPLTVETIRVEELPAKYILAHHVRCIMVQHPEGPRVPLRNYLIVKEKRIGQSALASIVLFVVRVLDWLEEKGYTSLQDLAELSADETLVAIVPLLEPAVRDAVRGSQLIPIGLVELILRCRNAAHQGVSRWWNALIDVESQEQASIGENILDAILQSADSKKSIQATWTALVKRFGGRRP